VVCELIVASFFVTLYTLVFSAEARSFNLCFHGNVITFVDCVFVWLEVFKVKASLTFGFKK
jgi:hypothetical protein